MPSIDRAIADGRSGDAKAVYLLVGTETLLIERALGLLRRAALGDESLAGFNEDRFDGDQASGGAVVAAANTLPMMAARRFVQLRRVDRLRKADQEELAAYVAAPADTACLVMTAEKLAGNTRLARAAKDRRVRYDAKALKGEALRSFVATEAKARGHVLAPAGAQALLDALGDDLAALDDALERLSLYVGPGQRIDSAAVDACIARVPTDSIWALVDAISVRDTAKAMRAAQALLAEREHPLRILAMVARQLRQVARMREALADGLGGEAAARKAGAPPFKARAMTEAARRFTLPELARAFETLAETDLGLKGSKVPGDVLLQEAVLRLCLGRA